MIQFNFVKTEEKGVFWKDSVANTDKVNFSWILTLFYPLLEFVWIVRTALGMLPIACSLHGTYQVFRQISELHSGVKSIFGRFDYRSVNFTSKLSSQEFFQKWMNEFIFTTMRRVFVHFLEEIKDTKKAFRN